MITGPVDLIAGAPRISIAHSGGVAVAVAVPADRAAAVGVDLQAADHAVSRLGSAAYTSPEGELLDQLDEAGRRRWAARLWTAKEAAAKAAGTGLPLVPAVLAVDPEDLGPADPADPVRLSVRRLDGSEPPGPASTVWTAVTADDLATALCLTAPGPSSHNEQHSHEGATP
jgi:hypothetical protein